MKTQQFFLSVTQKLIEWRQHYKELRHQFYVFDKNETDKHQTLSLARSTKKTVKREHRVYTVVLSCLNGKRSPVIFAIAVLSLTGVLGQKLYNQPQLQIGAIAPQTIRAPEEARIEDKKKTEEQRKAASTSSAPVLMVNPQINEEIYQNLQQILSEGNSIRSSLGAFPFFDTFILSVSTQRYLRSCSHWEWQALLIAVNNNKKHKQGLSHKEHRNLGTEDLKANNLFQNPDFAQAVQELETYHLSTSDQNLSSLIAQIIKVRQGYAQANTKLSDLIGAKPETVYEAVSLLDISDDDWAKTQAGIQQTARKILTQGIPSGLPPYIIKDAVTLHVQTIVPKETEPLAIGLLLAVLKPNLQTDKLRTQLIAARAAAGVKPVMVTVRKGELIVRRGEKITAFDFEVLEHYHLIRREINWQRLIQVGIAVTAAVSFFALLERRSRCKLRQSDRLLILLLTLSTPLAIVLGTPHTTWSAVGLLLGSFYGPRLGIAVIGLLSILLPISLDISKASLLAGTAAGILGSCMAQKLHSREELALLSVAIALTQGGVYLVLRLLLSAALGVFPYYTVIQNAVLFALSSLAWSIVALGLSPYLEKLFDLVTSIRLSELANPNRPLLKKLATETPGTFQHTLLVATLAEAAAKSLKCNVELVRAGALYHDIGKMHDPMAFIENQMGEPNKHDTEIKDPWKSAEVIKKHVSEGLVMARKHSLPSLIQAFIPEHQGTTQIAYFYHQAQQMVQADPSLTVDEADFRYEGPIPQSRETGIVMLADSCEAALRSLKEVSPEQALVMLNNILRAKWQDKQLEASGLTREEMSQIAEIFVQVWQQFHHKRIAYPKSK
ncbi:HDIG domain-containing protein [Scytonema sp. UIC 10036]|uniref:HD family phosphohydrolase n=1 Tax=Scytonema sp. UIC 10036 TaxID=2304196 RepID=UPI0012DA2AD7|nr:HD family phosphohydrolase [Scytonema sp. UIC 10036]MUG95270.1 HDIG domain-containing protein [Scytonema sp. UIC 10036]